MTWRNTIHQGDARAMTAIPDGSVDLVVTSPPYNVGIQYGAYDDNRTWGDYDAMLKAVWVECSRVLREGGRLCVNVANVGRTPAYRRHVASVADGIESSYSGWVMRGEIIWNKAASVGLSTAWGTWRNPSNPILRDVHEYILVYSKRRADLPRHEGAAGMEITAAEFAAWTQSIWTFPTESAKRVGHPAPFPVELPVRLIKLYTWQHQDTVILDPFSGSGTTCLAAKQLGRSWVGYDLDPQYVALARERVAPERFAPLFRDLEVGA